MTAELLGTMMDTLNEVMERAEAVLKRHGVSGRIPVGGYGHPDLGFKKVGDRWRLVWLTEGEPSLVSGSSREMRVLAAELVPELDRALAEEASGQADRIRAVIEALEEWVEGHEVG